MAIRFFDSIEVYPEESLIERWTSAYMTIPQRAEPTPIVLNGLTIGEWPSKEPTDVTFVVDLVAACDMAYVEQAPFLNFAEGGLARVRRVARAVIGDRNFDVDEVMHAYHMTHGHPQETAHRRQALSDDRTW